MFFVIAGYSPLSDVDPPEGVGDRDVRWQQVPVQLRLLHSARGHSVGESLLPGMDDHWDSGHHKCERELCIPWIRWKVQCYGKSAKRKQT